MSRVMVIDDEHAVRTMVRRLLEQEGHTVTEEPDGKSALRHFAGDPVDLVISDVFMPDMDGLDFLLRVKDVFPEAKIIVMSEGGPLSAESALTAASRLGANRVIAKPFDLQDMLAAIRAALADR